MTENILFALLVLFTLWSALALGFIAGRIAEAREQERARIEDLQKLSDMLSTNHKESEK